MKKSIIPIQANNFHWLTSIALLFSWSLLSATLIFFTLRYISPTHSAISYVIRMPIYTEAHPFPYLVSLAAVFSLFGAIWLRFFSKSKTWVQSLSALSALIVSLLAFSFVGALWWIWHDILAGFMPSQSTLIFNIKSNLATAPFVIAYVAILSMPASALALAISLQILFTVKIFNNRIHSDGPLIIKWIPWTRRLTFYFLFAAVTQVMLSPVYLATGNQLPAELVLGYILHFIIAEILIGIPMILALALISLPFLKWISWKTGDDQSPQIQTTIYK